ncbi:MAG: acetylserotonin O-methyltransferase [Actinobacteria bacterium]|nr:acetylserotonin O-methyltransferase [Actinomycetota bacterium]
MTAGELSPRDTLLRMTNAYQVSQAIHVAATLGIADLLEDGPRSADALAEATGTYAPTLYRLLRALASVGVFAENDGHFGLTPLAEYLRTGAPGSLRAWAMLVGQRYSWRSWGHLLHSVRTGEPAFPNLYGTSAWEYRAAHPEEVAVFNAAMTALSAGVLEAVVRSYDFSGIGVLVDVGGGEGVLLAAILATNPALRGILFDQPHVVTTAGALLERAGVADRCEVVSGNFFEAVPGGADAYLLKSIVHDWGDSAAIEILRACRAAIADTGRLLVVEPVIRPGNEPDPAKFSDLNMLVMLGGRERTADDFERLYAEAGFRLNDIIRTGSPWHIIEGDPV